MFFVLEEKIVQQTVAIDGWYGVDYQAIVGFIADELKNRGVDCEFVDASILYISKEALVEYKQPYITDDPGFGYVNGEGVISDIQDKDAVKALNEKLAKADKPVVVFRR